MWRVNYEVREEVEEELENSAEGGSWGNRISKVLQFLELYV
jgi:hypothetical protein